MATVHWDPDATEDMRKIAYYIGVQNRSPEAARKLVDDIRQVCERYATQPLMGEARPDLHPTVRIFSFKSYVALYFPQPDGIYVARIFHASRDWPSLFS